MYYNSRKLGFSVFAFLCFVILNGTQTEAVLVHHKGTHTGTVNGGALNMTVDVNANTTTGQVNGTAKVISPLPGNFRPSMACFSLVCLSCSNAADPVDGACSVPNFYDILGGNGTYTHTRIYSYQGYPAASLSVAANFTLAGDSLVYSGTWSGTTTSLPTDIIDSDAYTQVLTPAGDGIVNVVGSTMLTRSGGGRIPISWTGSYNLGAGNNLPDTAAGTIDIDGSTTNNIDYVVSGNSIIQKLSCFSIPTLSEWALIVFSVVLLTMMTYYVIRRRRMAQRAAI